MCPADLRTQTLFHKTWIHETESKPRYSIVLRSMAQLKTGWCLPAAHTPCTPSWIGGPGWPHPKCPHMQLVNPFQSGFFPREETTSSSIYYFALSPEWKGAVSSLHRANVRVFLFFFSNGRKAAFKFQWSGDVSSKSRWPWNLLLCYNFE